MKDKVNTKNTNSIHPSEYSESLGDQFTTREYNLLRGFLLNLSLTGKKLQLSEKQELFQGIIEVLDWLYNGSVTDGEFSTLFVEWQKSKSLLNCPNPSVELLVSMDSCISTLMGRSRSAKETVSKIELIEQIYMKFDCERVGYICAYQLIIIDYAIRDEQNQYFQYDADLHQSSREQLDDTQLKSIQSALQWEYLVPLISLKQCLCWESLSIELLQRTVQRLERTLQLLKKHFSNISPLSFDFLTSSYNASSHVLSEPLLHNPLSSPHSLQHFLLNNSSDINNNIHESEPFYTLFQSTFKSLLDYCTQNRYVSNEYFDDIYHHSSQENTNTNNTHQNSIVSSDNCKSYPQIFRQSSKYFQSQRNNIRSSNNNINSSKQLKKAKSETKSQANFTSKKPQQLAQNLTKEHKSAVSKTLVINIHNQTNNQQSAHAKQLLLRSSSMSLSPKQIKPSIPVLLKRVVNIKLDASLLIPQQRLIQSKQNQQVHPLTTKSSEKCSKSKVKIFYDPEIAKDSSKRELQSKQNYLYKDNQVYQQDNHNNLKQQSSCQNLKISHHEHEVNSNSQSQYQEQRKQMELYQQYSQSQNNLLLNCNNNKTPSNRKSSKCLNKTYTIIETLENMHHHPSGGTLDTGSSKLA